jgi:hypothetical protein
LYLEFGDLLKVLYGKKEGLNKLPLGCTKEAPLFSSVFGKGLSRADLYLGLEGTRPILDQPGRYQTIPWYHGIDQGILPPYPD